MTASSRPSARKHRLSPVSSAASAMAACLLGCALSLSVGCVQVPKSHPRPAKPQPSLAPDSEAVVEFDHRRLQLQLETARSRLRNGDSEGAELLLRRIVQRHPQQSDARRLLAELLSATNRLQEAEQHLRLQLRSFPQDAASHHELALLLETSGGRKDEADHHFRLACQIEPQNPLYRITCQ